MLGAGMGPPGLLGTPVASRGVLSSFPTTRLLVRVNYGCGLSKVGVTLLTEVLVKEPVKEGAKSRYSTFKDPPFSVLETSSLDIGDLFKETLNETGHPRDPSSSISI